MPAPTTIDHAYASGFLRGFDAGYRAAMTRAAEIARSKTDDEPDGYYGQACSEVAAAIEVERDREGTE